MKMSIRDRLPDVRRQVLQVPDIAREAVRRGINATVRSGRPAVYEAMRRAFDRPTPYTLNSLRIQEAEPGQQLAAAVMVKGGQDVTGGGVPAQSFLRAEIQGGARRWKRFEVALMRRGVLPRGWYAVPGQAARLDQWGNMSRGQVVQIMAYLQLFGVARGERPGGHRSNMSASGRDKLRRGTRSRFGLEVVVSSPLQANKRGGLPPGIYVRQTVGARSRAVGAPAPLRLVVVFVKSARYRQRLDFFGELQRHAAATMPGEVDKALRQVRATRPLKDAR